MSFSNGKGDLRRGILKPYTVLSAFLSVIEDCPRSKEKESGGVNLTPFITRRGNKNSKPDVDFKHLSGIMDSQSHPSASDKLAATSGGQGKKRRKKSHLLHNLTWSAFCQAASECLDLKLEEAYFARDCNISKKLKFLKCWMKQVKKHSICSPRMPESTTPNQDVVKEINHRLNELPQESEWLVLPQESEQPVSNSSSVGEVSSRISDEAANDFCSGTYENFFGSLPNKIQQGLESKELDLGTIAE
ncbi:hypothetical protein SLE2022_403040 [Rubroshorea leprosula]